MKQAEKNMSIGQLARRNRGLRGKGSFMTGAVTALWLTLQGTLGGMPGLAQEAQRDPLSYSDLLQKWKQVR